MVGVDVGRCFFPFFPFVGFIVCSETVVGTDVGACFFLFDFLVGFTVASVEGAIVGIDEGCDEAVTATDGATVGIDEGDVETITILEGADEAVPMLDGADEETILLLLLLGATDGDTPVNNAGSGESAGTDGAMNIMVGEDEGDNDTPVTSVGTIPVPVIKEG